MKAPFEDLVPKVDEVVASLAEENEGVSVFCFPEVGWPNELETLEETSLPVAVEGDQDCERWEATEGRERRVGGRGSREKTWDENGNSRLGCLCCDCRHVLNST